MGVATCGIATYFACNRRDLPFASIFWMLVLFILGRYWKSCDLTARSWEAGLARFRHFTAMCGLVAFVPGHLLMVALHGWNNFCSMLTEWKREAAPVPPEARSA